MSYSWLTINAGRAYNFIAYSVDKETELIDYDEVAALAKEHKPKLIVCGATAYSRVIDFQRFAKIAEECGAILMADISHIAGLVAAGVHPTPFGLADVVTTTTHKTLRGPRSAVIFCRKKYATAIDRAVFPGLQGGPHDHVTAAKAICFKEAMSDDFTDYAKQIIKNAQALAKRLTERGYRIVTGGTDNHLILVDLRAQKIPGKLAEQVLDKAHITVNKNTVPYDPNPPMDPSGIRLGTPAITSRGMDEKDMIQVADFIADALDHVHEHGYHTSLAKLVIAFASRFPLPGVDR